MTSELSADLANFISTLPKAEIHIHLEGSIQPRTVLALAERHKMLHTLPASDLEGLQRWYTFRDFPHFIDIYLTICDLLRTPEDFATIVYDCGADMAAQNIRYREVTFTPYLHTHELGKGLKIDEILIGLEQGRQRAKQDFDVEMRWVFDIPRNVSFDEKRAIAAGIDVTRTYDPRPAELTLEYALAGRCIKRIG